jgi:guanosine-3',5'-bis(diphosphate) 3'-pyrophosphohydrolase
MFDEFRPVLEAVAFAARAHAGQTRKDGRTPYASHAFRVALILRHVFDVGDPLVLATAVLHDTLEDTTTDYDDLEEQFGPEVARWTALLSKDKRQPFDQRESAYTQQLARSPWQVQVCKLADIFDNLMDIDQQPTSRRHKTLANARRYLDALRSDLQEPATEAWRIVSRLLKQVESQQPNT